jgi:SPP1 family predicted phage head-tail adaptor
MKEAAAMSDAIGAMRVRVTLQSPTRVADEIGGVAIAWTTAGVVWAEIEATGASQAAAFDGAPANGSFRVVINHRDDVRAGWRVAWGASVLRVTGVVDDGAPRIELICEEEVL